MKTSKTLLIRASISFPAEIYQSLESLAKHKKVSLAWVVREAAERYVGEEKEQGGEVPQSAIKATGKTARGAT